ncbi:rifin [Plasmodium falciparum NF54]|uniref:Rifin n=2 Tax=Plasmodium falciparum TaxID=5833 RepID=C0H5N8_PLAF7|nr:rifin [Plasmodium falciparum 3D7]KAF4326472.1 rifin [Plasmodium falciparum NF54]PKC44492.1 rifin [Plasmodium falciparum NF54]CAX64419.1 rifin [Plasmodium falciparum 3D7]|eukprot:XP_002809135.1 rifin [Plasmodium falciparum 3D7]
MKLHYSKILLFLLPLNILLTLHQVHSKNKPYMTQRLTQTNRSLCESDTESSIYDNDEEINSVKEIFERQTSQRLREYDERLQDKRQKRKEQRDKNIQKIIHKDKMVKNLEEKIEKGCLMCGCGLGSVAGSVGLFGGIAVNVWKTGALKIAIDKAIAAGATKIAEAAESAGAAEIMKLIKSKYVLSTLGGKDLGTYFATTSYKDVASITQAVSNQYLQTCTDNSLGSLSFRLVDAKRDIPFCNSVWNQIQAVSTTKKGISFTDGIKTAVQNIASDANGVANAAAEIAEATEKAKAIKTSTDAIEAASTQLYGPIGYSILAILIIVLIMLIIYLILRYRRKKKMKKKAQYTKLLNQ